MIKCGKVKKSNIFNCKCSVKVCIMLGKVKLTIINMNKDVKAGC